MPNMFGISLKLLSILHLKNIAHLALLQMVGTYTGTLPNGHANVVRYYDLVYNCRLWYPELTSIIGHVLYIVKPRVVCH